MLKKGQKVALKRTTLTGEVKRMVLVNDGEDLEHVVGFKDHDGVDQERSFKESDLELIQEKE